MFARRCVRNRATVATVRNRPQPSATVRVRAVWPCLWEVLQRRSFLEVSVGCRGCFVSTWQAWHFVTFRRVLQRVESRFAWQAQYFCDVFRTMCGSFRGRRSTLDVSIVIFRGRRRHFRRVVLRVFCKSHWQGCVKWRQGANSVAGVAFCEMC